MNKYTMFLAATAALSAMLLPSCSTTEGQAGDPYSYSISDGVITYGTPDRPKDQQSMLGFAADPIDTVKVGIVGLGMRGPGAVERMTFIDGVKIVALCDLYEDRVENAQSILEKRGAERAIGFSGEEGWKQLCELDGLDLVYICTPWLMHVPIAVYAMEQGKHVAIEVPAATSVKECWDLVNTSERTRKHCMMLENCCYDFFELTCLNMANNGLFGELYHAEGAYLHDLEPYWKEYQGNWRLDFNQKHRGDVYPTHGLGPICQAMNIHRGDRLKTLVSMDSDSFRGCEIAAEQMGAESFANGDHTSTLIRTEKGKTILIEHGVCTPRPYSRMYQLVGTEGIADKYPHQGLAIFGSKVAQEGGSPDIYKLDAERWMSESERDEIMKLYQHPITREGSLVETAKKVGGHGGMDFIMDYRLIYCLRNGLPLDQDVYDAAEWSCMTEISGVSIEHGCMPVALPDFTRGEWDKLNGLHLATK